MELRAGSVDVHYVESGAGRPVVVLHGSGVDHRETEACFEPAFAGIGDLRRIYPDLPGMGRTVAPASLGSADDVVDTMTAFVDEVSGGSRTLLVGHSAGGYFAQAIAGARPDRISGLALICPLLAGVREVPEHHAVDRGEIGDEEFRSYFVIRTPEMLERYERFVAPAAALVDSEAMERIGERWNLERYQVVSPFAGPTLVVAGRLDSTVGFAAASDLAKECPRASLAVLDHAGHALPHEQPELLRALVAEWIARVEQSV